MDGVALASVITSGVLGITTGSIAVWSARQSAKLARETRTQQRLAESYLEVLRIVEREGQWVDAGITNWWLAVEEAEIDPDAREQLPWLERVKVPEPVITDQATIAAHLAAFGSENVRKLYQDWRSTISVIERRLNELDWAADEHSSELFNPDNLRYLQHVLHPEERAARQALADAIAEELGHW